VVGAVTGGVVTGEVVVAVGVPPWNEVPRLPAMAGDGAGSPCPPAVIATAVPAAIPTRMITAEASTTFPLALRRRRADDRSVATGPSGAVTEVGGGESVEPRSGGYHFRSDASHQSGRGGG